MYESVTQNFYTSVSKKVGGIETCNFYMHLSLLIIQKKEWLVGICWYYQLEKESKNIFKKFVFTCPQPPFKLFLD